MRFKSRCQPEPQAPEGWTGAGGSAPRVATGREPQFLAVRKSLLFFTTSASL